jgi:ribosome-binding protein aMBF1 (putative translation factor)
MSISAETYRREESDPNFKMLMETARAGLAEDYRDAALPNDLAKLRLSRGFSQTSLASIIGTSQSHVAKIEARVLDVKFSTAEKLADALAISMDVLRPLISISDEEPFKIKTSVSAL